METPSSMRRLTRSQASAASLKSKQEETLPRSRNALLDITNDSPIVGLALATTAVAEKTPSSSAIKKRVGPKRTPGSGEALLRGQVKTLLQKVEEEGEIADKLSSGDLPPARAVLGSSRSPTQLLAPIPANTTDAMMASLVEEDTTKIPLEVVSVLKQVEHLNRALLFDSPAKSQVSVSDSTISSSSLTNQWSQSSSSAWSIQVNASSPEDDEEEEEPMGELEEVDDDGDESLDDLCDEMTKMSMAEFRGKHTRFVYNSDDEIEGEEEVGENCKAAPSPSVLLLKGLPAPEGKHLRFQEEN
ncbi:uncharacterized protein [Typha angustifolia]|uniref:uncharacterized protein n=1 Tax=Typha angustifolia TaxID=59011 RepID=UPI003C2AEB65